MEKHEIGEWADKLLSMAIGKCGNLEDARDLTQETLLSWLTYKAEGKVVDNDAAFMRTVLTRKYYDQLRRKYQLPTVAIDDEIPLCDETEFMDTILRREQAEEIRREVAFLAQSYRVIIAGHYFHGKSVKVLSEELLLPQGTVKSRLDFGRKQLKKGLETMENSNLYTENSYIPQRLKMSNSGVCGLNEEPFSLTEGNLLAQNLLILSYEKPIGISDLSRAIGVASAYVEPVVDKLVQGELMKRMSNGKVYTDFIIYRNDDFTKYIEEEEAFAEKHADAYCRAVESAIEELKKTDFYSLRLERYMLIHIADSGLWNALKDCRAPHILPQRPNGGSWIAFGIIDSDPTRDTGLRRGKEEYGISGQRYTSLDKYLDSGTIKLYNYESSLSPEHKYEGFGFNTFQETEAALLKLFYLIRHGIAPETVDCDSRLLKGIPLLEERGFLTTEGGRPVLSIPCLTPSEERRFWDICWKASQEFARQVRQPLSEYVACHKKRIPEHLKSVPEQKLTMPYEPNTMMFVFQAINRGIHPRNPGYPCPESFVVME